MLTISTTQAIVVCLILIGLGFVFGGCAINTITDNRLKRLEEEVERVEREYGGFCQGGEGTE